MARRRVGETKRRLSFASASTPAPARQGHIDAAIALGRSAYTSPPRPKSTCFVGAGADAGAGGGGGGDVLPLLASLTTTSRRLL